MDRIRAESSQQLVDMSAGKPSSAAVLGVRVDCVIMGQALNHCAQLLDTAGHHQVVTLNPEFVMHAQQDTQFRELVREASLVVPDGSGIVWALRRQGNADVERVTGIDLMLQLCALAARRQVAIFLLGAAPGVAAQTAAVLQQQYPKLIVAGTAVGAPDAVQAPALCAQIRDSGAGLLFVAFGCPAQDFWIQQHQRESGACLAMGVGGSFDYISGKVARAPRRMQQMNLEWFYRLLRQPWRWRRQRVLISYLWRVLREH